MSEAEPTLVEDATETFYSEQETVHNEPETAETELENVQESEEAQTGEGKSEDEPLESDTSEDSEQFTVDLSTIAQALGFEESDLDIDEDGDVVINTKIDGEDGKAKGKDFFATYQKQGHLDNRLREVNQREENLKTQETNFQESAQQKLQQFEDLNKVALNALNSEFNQIDWNYLRESDPGEYSAKQQDFRNRQGQIQQALNYTAKQREDTVAQNRAQEAQKVVTLMDGWNDPVVAKKEETELAAYAADNNMNPEIANFADFYVLAKKAKAYDELNQSKPEIKKLVKRASKVSKQRNTKPAETPKSDADYFY